jgi:hypothetical protein
LDSFSLVLKVSLSFDKSLSLELLMFLSFSLELWFVKTTDFLRSFSKADKTEGRGDFGQSIFAGEMIAFWGSGFSGKNSEEFLFKLCWIILE